MMNLMMKTKMVIMALMRIIQIKAHAGSNIQHMTLARDASFDNLFPIHDHCVLDHFENITRESCVLHCLRYFSVCSGLLYSDKLRICELMVCLLNTRFLERSDGWQFLGNDKVCESGWYPFTGHCYHLNKTAVQWRDAQTQCKRQKSYLVEVNTAAENKWLLETFLTANGNGISQPVTSLWLGAKRRKGILTWGHSNNPISKQSWVTENLDGKGGCVLMKHTGMWIDVGCSWDEYFVCEKLL